MTKWKILETNRKLKDGTELVDIFDTKGSADPLNWEWVAVKVRRADAEKIVAAVSGTAKVEVEYEPAT